MTFPAEVTVEVTVEVLEATRGTTGRYADQPERCWPSEPDAVELCVRLGTVDVTAAVPADVLEALAAEALERLQDAAMLTRLA
jgi:hypothetical protein